MFLRGGVHSFLLGKSAMHTAFQRTLAARIVAQVAPSSVETKGKTSDGLIMEYRTRDTVPDDCPEPTTQEIDNLARFIEQAKGKLVVLSGAGLSTESGIPDYRTTQLKYKTVSPITHQQFVLQVETRQRYWARSFFGYPRLTKNIPNAGHHALAKLQHAGAISAHVTQNVDGLFSRAYHHAMHNKDDPEFEAVSRLPSVLPNVIELHGCIHRVVCLSCQHTHHRGAHQNRLTAQNKAWTEEVIAMLNPSLLDSAQPDKPMTLPDGDFELTADHIKKFEFHDCDSCGGLLMPHLVFFGGKVPEASTIKTRQWIDDCSHLLVLGSTCVTWSAYRLVRQAKDAGKQVCVATFGNTRADTDVTVPKIEARLGNLLGGAAAKVLGV